MQSEEAYPPTKRAKVTSDDVVDSTDNTSKKDTIGHVDVPGRATPMPPSSSLASPPCARRGEDTKSSCLNLDPIHPVKVRHSGQWKNCENGAVLYRTFKPAGLGNSDDNVSIAGFDMGGTLLDSLKQYPSSLMDYELWNTNVISKLRDLSDEGHHIIIFINQGGIRGAINGKTATKVKDLIEWIVNSIIERPVYAFVSTKTKSGFHKPSALMWEIAEKVLKRTFDISNSFFVGDSVDREEKGELIRGDDEKFASEIGIRFFTPKEFFGASAKEQRLEQKIAANRLAYKNPPKEALVIRAALCGGYLKGPILVMVAGPQGAGKSYFCHQLVAGAAVAKNWVHLSQDTIRGGKPGTREAVEKHTKRALMDNKSVIVDRMHLDETQRSFFINVAKDVGVPIHCIVLTTPKSVVVERVLQRTDHPGSVQGESGSRLAERSWTQLVMPTYQEGFSLISATGTTAGVDSVLNLYRKVVSASSSYEGQGTIPNSFYLPKITLGTYLLGKKKSEDIVAKAISLGVAAVDTAPTYNNEEQVGGGLDKDVFLVVKVPKRATTAKMVKDELVNSLRKLGREKADLLLLHWPCDVIAMNAMEEVWLAMEKCVKDGFVSALGVCNFNVSALCLLLPICVDVRPSVLQIERHILLPQWDIVEFCAQHDILIQAHTPLGQGKLTHNAIVKDIAATSRISPAQVLLQWNIIQNVAIVTKSTSEDHLKEIVDSGKEVFLSENDMKVLDEIGETTRFVSPPFMFGNEPYCWEN